MKYTFCFYTQNDFSEIENLILNSYQWEFPAFGLSRMEFSNGLHPKFTGYHNVWERTCGVYKENGKIVASAINEANDCGDAFFLFDTKERSQDKELLEEMIFFAKTTMSVVNDPNCTKRESAIYIPEHNTCLMQLAEKHGYKKDDYSESIFIRDFNGKHDVTLPEGYSFADGNTTPAFYRANVHMAAFNYSIKKVPNCENAMADIRNQKHYDPDLDLVILDPYNRPIAMANIWCDERMPYCELEPLGVAWWERRKGFASAILQEATNRVITKYPNCKGMTGGDQEFYRSIGFTKRSTTLLYQWSGDIYISWDEKSKDMDFNKLL